MIVTITSYGCPPSHTCMNVLWPNLNLPLLQVDLPGYNNIMVLFDDRVWDLPPLIQPIVYPSWIGVNSHMDLYINLWMHTAYLEQHKPILEVLVQAVDKWIDTHWVHPVTECCRHIPCIEWSICNVYVVNSIINTHTIRRFVLLMWLHAGFHIES